MGYIERGQHPFEPRSDGQGCRQLIDVVDHRPVECGTDKGAGVHTGTRPQPPELDYRPPLCSLCGQETSHDGDSICCDSCGAYWPGSGPGSWNEPETLVCTSQFKPFDRDNLAPEHENIRHQIRHCLLPLDHANAEHRSDEFTTWTDEESSP